MADLSKIKLNGTDYNLKDAEARNAIENIVIPQPDWTENNLSSSNYVQNRTHYIKWYSEDNEYTISPITAYLADSDNLEITVDDVTYHTYTLHTYFDDENTQIFYEDGNSPEDRSSHLIFGTDSELLQVIIGNNTYSLQEYKPTFIENKNEYPQYTIYTYFGYNSNNEKIFYLTIADSSQFSPPLTIHFYSNISAFNEELLSNQSVTLYLPFDTNTNPICEIHKLNQIYLPNNVMIKNVDYITTGQLDDNIGEYATAEGYATTASGNQSHAEGYSTTASNWYSHAEGYYTTASGERAHAEGSYSRASGFASHAEGASTTASGGESHAEGTNTTASGAYSHTEGYYTTAQRRSQHVFGEYNVLDTVGTTSTKGNYIEIVGNGTSSSKRSNARTLDWSGNETLAGKLTLGSAPTANMDAATKQYVDSAYVIAGKLESSTLGTRTTAEGYLTVAEGDYSHAEGYITKASGEASHAEGEGEQDGNDIDYTLASGDYSHAEGYTTQATSQAAHSEGNNTKASGYASHAEGQNTKASGTSSHAEGYTTTASNSYAHAEGSNTTASGDSAHAEGIRTTASGNYAHTEGYWTQASGADSHAEGYFTTASGPYSHTEGYYTIAQRRSQHVFGEYNALDTFEVDGTEKGIYIEIVGNGTSAANRSNARTLDWGGNETLAGKLTVGASPTANMDVATKQYVDNAIPTVPTNISSFTNDAGYQNSTQVNSAITTAIGNINSFDVAVVASTASVTTPNNHTIYFVPQAVNSSVHDEYMYINNNWELIGTTTVDLSGYLQKTEIANWAKAANKPSYTASEVGAMATTHAANAITSTDISNWNAKSNFSGSYNDLTNKPTIPTVPTNVSSFTNDAGYLTLADLPTYDGTVQNG